MISTCQETEILDFLKRAIFFIHKDLSNIRYVFRKGDTYLPISADKLLDQPQKYLPLIFDETSYSCHLAQSDKADIHIVLHDQRTRMNNDLGFSIKSHLGKSSTLFNPEPGTNFIYRIDLPDGVSIDCDKFNRDTYEDKDGKIAYRLSRIEEMGGVVSFDHIQSSCLHQNLRTIDSEMPRIMAHALLIKYQYKLTDWPDIITKLNELNPLDFRITEDSPAYEYKIKRFLQDAAMGMTPEKPWSGTYVATGGQIVVKKDGDIVCYTIHELNRYLNFLFNETRLEQASTSEDENNPGHVRINPETGKPNKPYKFGWVYEEDGQFFIKINLQVRFKEIVKNKRKKKSK